MKSLTSLWHGLVQINPRPCTNYCSQGRAVLATDVNGFIEDDPRQGFFVCETRVLSRYRHLLEGKQPQRVVLSNVEQHSWLGYYICSPPHPSTKPDGGSGEMEPVSEQTIEIKISRNVGLGLHEDIDVTNFTDKAVRLTYEIELDADFADQAETKHRKQKGRLRRRWCKVSRKSWELTFDYRAEHRYSHQGNRGTARFECGTRVRIENADSRPSYRNHKLRFPLTLKPAESWHTCIKVIPVFGKKDMQPLYGCRQFFVTHNELDQRRQKFLSGSTHFACVKEPTLAATVSSALNQAKADLADLRLPDMDFDEHAWIMAAGLPIYVALFGRDTLTASWQAAMASPSMMRGTLRELPKWQGKIDNDWRDEQPGRMLHEAHTGPLAKLNYNPRSRYYGAATTSSFYPVVLSELWHWTGEKALVRKLIGPALRGLAWKDRYTDLFGDGFYDYQTHSKQGNRNQGWKDSNDAIVYEDGTLVDPPISTCEEQAFVYVAKLRMSELLWSLGDRAQSKKMFHEASELKKRFNDVFWMPDKKYFALGLDSKRQQIKSISSDPGHLLACGIVDKSLAAPVAKRLLQSDMYTGWGVRTLSSDHPAFDPYSYHRGSVWPVEHGSFAMGMMRFGLIDELHTIARGIFEVSALFSYHRLPECFSGHPRDAEHPFPALYPKTNWPQAWSAASVFAIMQAILGIYPYAPLNLLLVDPQVPEWLPEITVRNLHIGQATVDIRFYRQGARSHFDVLDKRGKLHVVRQPSTWSLTSGFGERLHDVMESLVA